MLEHELLGPFGIFLLEEAGVGAAEESSAHFAAEGVAELVAQDGGCGDGEHDQPQGLVEELVVGH